MSRFSDYDDFEGEPEQILAMGRWQRNARAVLRSKRGRKALTELREALMALPEHRLIESALCTVGGVDKRLPSMTDEQVAAKAAEFAAAHPDDDGILGRDWPRRYAEIDRRGVEESRRLSGNSSPGRVRVSALSAPSSGTGRSRRAPRRTKRSARCR